MFVKLVVYAWCVALVLGQKWHGPLAGGQPADLYPAGVSPQACPNFPNCDNPAVAVAGSQSHGAWNGAGAGGWNGNHANGQWSGNNRQWNGNNGNWNGNNGQWNGNNGQWNNGAWNGAHAGGWNGAPASAWNGAPAGVGHAAQVPAGVDPHSCPNYPFCH